jgi:hypothetical protein
LYFFFSITGEKLLCQKASLLNMHKKSSMAQRAVYEFEHFTDHIIPVLVVFIAVVLILENPFWTLVHLEEYAPWPTIFDTVVLFFFIVDLLFKWFRTRNIRKFFKLYWIDVIAVFPFYLAFRVYGELAGIFRLGEELTETSQKLAHEAVLLREAGAIGEAERAAKEARVLKEAGVAERMIRTIARFLRVLKGRFYTTHRAFQAIHEEHAREHRRVY